MITVYGKPSCVQCDATKRAMDQRGIRYRYLDLTTDREAQARVAEFGYRQAPIVEVGPDRHWCGFRPDLIREITPGMQDAE
ncbi:glutaredoxin domain-containing protein [Pseudogemmobacter sonorensis]|uniref:glutaredoxin domain-containing protein n=1 Tax=Pseudogemmobacter sonorensis TaxID=2989681 RepID=UPI003684A439